MSDTPRTDAEYQQWETLEEAARFSQELERENAALLKDVCDLVHKNELLREALDTLTHVIGLTPIAGNKAALQEAFDMARAALRKEAQP